MEKNRDKTISLLRICTKDRQELDDPAYKPNIFYGEIAADFNNTKLLFDVPANKHKIVGHEDLSANDFRRINILRTGAWIKKVQGTWFPILDPPLCLWHYKKERERKRKKKKERERKRKKEIERNQKEKTKKVVI